MKDEKIVEKVVTVSLVPDLPVGTVFVFEGKKQKYEVTPREYDILCNGCVFQWDKLERDTPARKNNYVKCASFRCHESDRKDGKNVKAVKVRSSRRGKEV